MKTSLREIFKNVAPGPELTAKEEARLAEAWASIMKGRGSPEDAELVMQDLADASGYFYLSPPGSSADELQRREGAREVYARILFLLDLPMSYIGELRRVALDQLQASQLEG